MSSYMLAREEIISAIKQTTRNNANVPLGVRAFEKETGIKESDRSGIYWARWGDAVKEAGFESNTFTKRADKSFLLEQLIPAIRYFGKLPTTAEFRLYSKKSHTKLPSDKTIRNHFPTKAELIVELSIYTSGKPEFEDVFSLCQKLNVPQKEDAIKSNIKEGYVYLFKSGNHYKIGNSYNVEQRVKQIKTQMPDSLTIIHTIRTDDPSGIEAYWHKRFDDKRANGEWFKLATSDVAAFRRRKFQ